MRLEDRRFKTGLCLVSVVFIDKRNYSRISRSTNPGSQMGIKEPLGNPNKNAGG